MPKTVMIQTKECPHCREIENITVPVEEYTAYFIDNKFIQVAMPSLTADQRERFLSGLCGSCWNIEVPDEDEDCVYMDFLTQDEDEKI